MAYRDLTGLAKVRLRFRPALIDFNVFVAVGPVRVDNGAELTATASTELCEL